MPALQGRVPSTEFSSLHSLPSSLPIFFDEASFSLLKLIFEMDSNFFFLICNFNILNFFSSLFRINLRCLKKIPLVHFPVGHYILFFNCMSVQIKDKELHFSHDIFFNDLPRTRAEY